MPDTLPTTPRVAVLLKLAEAISVEMGWKYVGTEHILLALFRIPDGLGNRMLKASGANEETARKELQYWNDPTLKLREENAALLARIAELSSPAGRAAAEGSADETGESKSGAGSASDPSSPTREVNRG